MSTALQMEVRNVDVSTRTVEGLVVPYNETTYAIPDPRGERVMRGAFRKSISENGDRLLLFVEHRHDEGAVGRAVSWSDTDDGLRASFRLRQSASADLALEELREGYLPFLSVGFVTIQGRHAEDGVVEIVEGRLMEVSAVSMGAYAGAVVESVRKATSTSSDVLALAEFLRRKAPQPDLSPVPRLGG